MSKHYSDIDLIAGIKNKNTCNFYFNHLVKKYQERLYWHIRRMVIIHEDADDIIQQVFVKAWKGIHQFREDSQLYTWLYRIATNETITFINQKKKKDYLSAEGLTEKLSNSLESDDYFTGDEIQLKLQRAILTLPEKQRMVFNMKYFEDMKYSDMSAILNTSEGGLKASYHHAVKKIEEYLTNN